MKEESNQLSIILGIVEDNSKGYLKKLLDKIAYATNDMAAKNLINSGEYEDKLLKTLNNIVNEYMEDTKSKTQKYIKDNNIELRDDEIDNINIFARKGAKSILNYFYEKFNSLFKSHQNVDAMLYKNTIENNIKVLDITK